MKETYNAYKGIEHAEREVYGDVGESSFENTLNKALNGAATVISNNREALSGFTEQITDAKNMTELEAISLAADYNDVFEDMPSAMVKAVAIVLEQERGLSAAA